MTPTRLFSAPDSTAGSLRPDLPYGEVCAIHQPNLFPPLVTLAKLFAADYWIVLDDVQFARRHYQHRAPRLARRLVAAAVALHFHAPAAGGGRVAGADPAQQRSARTR